jgi:ABC-type enterochelin transport system substrate-binding protein
MKKLLILAALGLALALTACGAEDATPTPLAQPTEAPGIPPATLPAVTAPEPPPREWVTITDINDNVVQVRQNPTVVAVYDQGILDMMYTIGFEHFGIETLIVPNPSGLPPVIQGINNIPGLRVIDGGTLFYVNWDVLDLVPPELIILGARSFGMNAAGDRLAAEDVEDFRARTEERYGDTAFIRLTINAQNSDLLNDMTANANALAQIWPHVADYLMAELDSIREGMEYVAAVAQESGYRAVFLMMTTPDNLSLFLANSRMDMVYEEFGFAPAIPPEDLGAFTDQHGFESRAEFVLALDPDVIFLLDRNQMADNIPESAGHAALIADPIIQRTSAYIGGHIYALYPQEWYTVVGGFGSARQMVADMMRFVENFRD